MISGSYNGSRDIKIKESLRIVSGKERERDWGGGGGGGTETMKEDASL